MDKKIAIGLGIAAVGGLFYFLTRKAKAAPLGYICPYCGIPFDTYGELVAHVQIAHPGERIPLEIEWD